MSATVAVCLCGTLRVLCDLCGFGFFKRKGREELAKDREGIPWAPVANCAVTAAAALQMRTAVYATMTQKYD